MIIDEILDARDFNRKINLEYILEDAKIFDFNYIVEAIKTKDKTKIKNALKKYILESNYNKKIINCLDNVI